MVNNCSCNSCEIALSTPCAPEVSLVGGDIPEAISKHNLDPDSHPYILQNFATKEYAENLVDNHNISPTAHQDIRNLINNALGTYVFTQDTENTTWTINHNLQRYPSVSIIDSDGDVVLSDVKYIDANKIILVFSVAIKGKAYLN